MKPDHAAMMLEAVEGRNRNNIDGLVWKGSGRSLMKAKVRADESSKILGMLRKIANMVTTDA